MCLILEILWYISFFKPPTLHGLQRKSLSHWCLLAFLSPNTIWAATKPHNCLLWLVNSLSMDRSWLLRPAYWHPHRIQIMGLEYMTIQDEIAIAKIDKYRIGNYCDFLGKINPNTYSWYATTWYILWNNCTYIGISGWNSQCPTYNMASFQTYISFHFEIVSAQHKIWHNFKHTSLIMFCYFKFWYICVSQIGIQPLVKISISSQVQ